MSISWRNSTAAFFLLCVLSLPAHVMASGTIDDILALTVSGAPFTAGAQVNTADPGGTNSISFIINAGTQTPTGGQVVNLQLFSGSSPIEGGIAPTSFVTPGVGNPSSERALYGGASFHLVPIQIFRAGSNLSVRASAAAQPAIFDQTSTFTVIPGSPTRLVAFVPPDMTFDPGKNTGSGAIGSVTREPFEVFTVRVNQTDAFFNLVTSPNPNVTLSVSGDLVSYPASATPLVNGTVDFPVSISIARSERVVFANAPSRSQGSVLVRTAGPEKETIFPFPSPFNPGLGSPMTFRFQLNDAASVKVIVKDQFGQDVWRTEYSGPKGQNNVSWDGRNERGHVVAAGVYYALLEVKGEITSKKRFGVVK